MKDEIDVARLISLAKKPFPPIEMDFYGKIRVKIRELNRMIEEAEKDGDDEKKQELGREKENIIKYGYKIYNKRMRSLMVQISKKLAGGSSDLSQFTEEERELFEEICDRITEKRSEILEGMRDIVHKKKFEVKKETDEKETKETPAEPEKREGEKERKKSLIPVKMLSDEAFVGLDGHYFYPKKGDVLHIPKKMADILVKGKYAERIEVR